MANIGFPEILVILVIVLLLFGAKRIPEIAGSMGKGIREFKKSMTEVERAISEPEQSSRRLPSEPPRETVAQQEKDEERVAPKRLLN